MSLSGARGTSALFGFILPLMLGAVARGGAPEPLPDLPVARLRAEGYVPLFDGKTWAGWNHPLAMEGRWEIRDGAICLCANQPPRPKGQACHLSTIKQYGDFVLLADWRLMEKPHPQVLPWLTDEGTYHTDVSGRPLTKVYLITGDSGIFLRGAACAQVNIWDQPCGSGEIGTKFKDMSATREERRKTMPKVRADRGRGEWNRFVITLRRDRVDVVLNGVQVIKGARIKNIPNTGPITFQNHLDPVEFRNLFIRELRPLPK